MKPDADDPGTRAYRCSGDITRRNALSFGSCHASISSPHMTHLACPAVPLTEMDSATSYDDPQRWHVMSDIFMTPHSSRNATNFTPKTRFATLIQPCPNNGQCCQPNF